MGSRRERVVALGLGLLAACAGHPEPAERAACKFGRGDLPAVTLADQALLGEKIPIDHFVFVMQENRSFDHYFSSLTVPGQTVDGAAPGATNPDPTNPQGTIARFHQPAWCFDNPAEEWDDLHLDYDEGKLDGFTARNALDDPLRDPTGRRALGYYDEHQLPFYYGLARAFAISDRHFSSALTNTFPNRLFFMAGTSFGVTSDVLPMRSAPNLFTRLNEAGISWKVYSQDYPTPAILTDTWASNLSHFFFQDQFFTDAAAGQLPSLAFVEGSDRQGGASPNEDPPADPQVGQAMVAQIVKAVIASPNWPRSALLITWDEPGGLYDHVVPPAACAPDAIAPNLNDGGFVAGFDQLGLRVPLIAVSPFARRGHVSHQVTDHTSLLRLVEARFSLPALTRRDANAEPPFELFDFAHPDLSAPTLPAAEIDDAGVTGCLAAYPPKGP